jgi:Galactose oxidase, central domain
MVRLDERPPARLARVRNCLWGDPAGLTGRQSAVAVVICSLVLGALIVASAGASQARNLSPSPAPRYGAAMVYDAHDGYILLFGGAGGPSNNPLNDTWKFQNGTWTQLHPKSSPPGRYWAMMAYDAVDSEVVLFGGVNVSTNGSTQDLNDTWVYSSGSWTEIRAVTHPAAREAGMMAFDVRDGYLLLFGGSVLGARGSQSHRWFNDTWSFGGGLWTRIHAEGAPQAWDDGGLAYDAASGRMILVGGLQKSAGRNPILTTSTWSYRGGTWSQLSSSQNATPVGEFTQLVYNPNSGSVIAFDDHGANPTARFLDNNWTTLVTSHTPPARSSPSMAYDPAAGYSLMFGGFTSTSPGFWNDTWEFSGTWHML